MKKIIMTLLCMAMIPWGMSFSQDNIYGDYLIYSLEKNVSLDLESAQLVDVLKMLSQQTKLNFVSTEAVQDRELTLYMENVPLKDAMNIIFKANGLGYDYYPDSNIFVVKEMGKPSLELKTKIYRLNYVWVDDSRVQKEIDELISMEEDEDDTDDDGEGEEGGTGIKGAVSSVLSPAGSVTENRATNSLVVVDVPSQFPMIDEVVRALDVAPQRVLIEVEMLDVSKKHLEKLGFDWENGYARYAGPSKTTPFPFSMPTGVGEVVSFGIIDLTRLDVTLNFLMEDRSAKFLARPKILTLSNETAEVNITADAAIGASTTFTGSAAETATQNIERATVGTRLRVTPQVNQISNEITLVVEVFNKDARDSGIDFLGDGNIKDVEERSAKSVMRLQEGETLYIGGLIARQELEIKKKVPFLGDIPFIGAAFRYTEKPTEENEDRELMIFLTPHIIDDKPFLANKRKSLSREQVDYSKQTSMKFALDSFDR